MLIKSAPSAILSSEITPESVYQSRRSFIGNAGLAALWGLSGAPLTSQASERLSLSKRISSFTPVNSGKFNTDEPLTPYKDVTSHNNFYEFGVDKGDPAKFSSELTVNPWEVMVDGAVENPGKYNFEDIIAPHALEERVYRLRCVEAWSMVIPWLGIPLADLISRLAPTSKAKYVYFESVHRPSELRGQRSAFSTIKWPYVEGLRMDEAMNPLSFLAVGLYGKVLPTQNGAPIRLVVPWKYGFKSIKSIVRISFRETRKLTSWESIAPREYGFYANVNPGVDHPRWSQKIERRLPSSLFDRNTRKTEIFNGYGEQVAHMYKGMDLSSDY